MFLQASLTCTALGIISCCTSAVVNSTGVTTLRGKLAIQGPQKPSLLLMLLLPPLLLLLLLLLLQA
jgi:hypothetical protein